MAIRLSRLALAVGATLTACSLFAGGYVAGQARFGQPRSVVHAVSIQWNEGVSDAEKGKVFDGVRQMAETIPGVKNVWIKSERVEPRGFDDGFAIEFRDRAAADAYATSAAHKTWSDHYLPLRAASVSIDLTNP
jgi:stress responsive alpha/beta barrel protein